jgi:hypothetical protein
MVVTDAIFDGADVRRQFFGERQCFAHHTGNPPLPQGVVEAFNVIGVARLLRDGSVSLCRNHTFVCFITTLYTMEHKIEKLLAPPSTAPARRLVA